MSDVPIGPTPEPSVSAGRAEAMGALGEGVARVGQRVGGAVAGAAAARSSVADTLEKTSAGIKQLQKDVDDFVSRSGKKFADHMERVSSLLGQAQQASKGLGESLGSVGQGYERYAASREQTAKSLEGARGHRPADHAVQAPLAAAASNRQAGPPMANGGVNAGSGVPGSAKTIIHADSVEVHGPGGGGPSGGGPGGPGGNAGDKPNGGEVGFLGRSARFAGLLGVGAAIRATGGLYNEVRQELRPQQTAFQRVGFGRAISEQQAGMRDYHAMGVSEFGSEDLTGALNIGASYLGGTNFRMTSLGGLQQASLDMSATQAAQVAQTVGEPSMRMRLYQYGISTKGLSPEERIMAAARFALQKREGEALTAEDYNMLSTQGETAASNLQHLFGGDQAAMQAARDLVGERAGITGLDAANPTLRSEVEKDVARREMTNEMLNNIAGFAEAQNKILTDIYDSVKGFPEWAQSMIASLGGTAGPAQGALGALGGGLLGGVGGAGGVGILRRVGTFLRGGPKAPISPAAATATSGAGGGGALAAAGTVASGLATTLTAKHLQGKFADWASDRVEGFKEAWDVASSLNLGGLMRQGIGGLSLGGDTGDPPEGSNIRTGKPAEHVTGMRPNLRSALEAMFRDNPRLRLNSGFRSVDHQQRLWRDALKKYGSAKAARKWVAPPGKSKHNSGLAADIGPRSEYDWIKRNASRYGLHVPMTHEPWHVEPIGSRSGKEVIDLDIASGGLADKEDSAGQSEERGFSGKMFNLSGVTSSEGDVFASLLGGAGLFGGIDPFAPSPEKSTGEGADQALRNSAGLGGSAFSGDLASKAASVARVAKQAGFRGNDLVTAVAIALGESSGNPRAHNPDASTGDNSYGLWQINMLGGMGPDRRARYGLRSNAELFDPSINARAAYDLYRQKGGGFGDWSVYKRGDYKQYLDEAQAGVSDVGDPATPGAGIDGALRGGSVVMRGGNKTVQMYVLGQQNPEGLVREVMKILNEEEEFEMVGES